MGDAMAYRIGIDVGERSVGLAAIEYSVEDKPVRVLAAVSHIHDGGMTPGTAKSPESRLASAGIARRTRRLVRNRRKRLAALDSLLASHGVPVSDPVDGITYQQWRARAELLEGFVEDSQYRNELLSLAIRHIARHRGWRNPWWSFERLVEAPTPTEQMGRMTAEAATRFGVDSASVRYVGQIGARSASREIALRPRTRTGALAAAPDVTQVLSVQVQQQDQLAELREILGVQQVTPEFADAILRMVFTQEKPHVPTERVGRDALPGMRHLLRAPVGALEFQEFRVLAAVANLRIAEHGSERSLSAAEHDLVVDNLIGASEAPVWAEIAELLEVRPRALHKPTSDEEGAGARAPIDRTSAVIAAKFPPKHPFGAWWRAADATRRAEAVQWLLGAEPETLGDPDAIAELIDIVDLREKFDAIDLPSGRAAYSIESLRLMNAYMREKRCDLHTARRACFNVDNDWQPPRPRLDDAIEHPTVDRVVTIVRRFLVNAVEKWGLPDSIMIEHVRGSFMGPSALAEFKYELRSNERRNERNRSELIAAGVAEPSRRDIRRFLGVQQQNGKCLYCGAAISFSSCELDHIVPSTLGGSNREENLVAVCRPCNQSKSNTPFAVWAVKLNDPRISLSEARGRLREWNWHGRSPMNRKSLQAAIVRRLEATTDDEFPDDRSMASTAYAARELRFRIETFVQAEALKRGLEVPDVRVFRGTMTAEARRAGGIDSMLRLRRAKAKTRLDRRHHAIDAAVLTTLNDSVAQTMGQRHRKRVANEFARDDEHWKDFEGVDAGHRASWLAWRERAGALAGLLVDAIQEDRIPVMRSLRLTPRFGAVHADTVRPLVSRPVVGEWSLADVSRVADLGIRKRLVKLFEAGTLEEAGAVRAALPEEISEVKLFAKDSAQIALRGGSAEIGASVHHARVYAWRTQRGEINYGWVRVFAGEFPLIGFGPGVNVLTAPIPLWSQAMLKANRTLLKRIMSGEAVEIGWLTVDDELEFDASEMRFSTDKFGTLMQEVGDTHWICTGFFTDVQISLVPSMLASEGADASLSEVARDVLVANRLPLSVNVAMSLPQLRVLRRTALGSPRWRGTHLPVSWCPRDVAEARLPK